MSHNYLLTKQLWSFTNKDSETSTDLIITGIKCFSRLLLVAHDRKPSKLHFQGRIRRRISEKMEETCEDFSRFYLPS